MSINAIFDVAGSAMSAQSVRLNTVASNLANAQSASSSIGQTYRARHPVFAAIQESAMNGVAGVGPEGEASVGVQVLGVGAAFWALVLGIAIRTTLEDHRARDGEEAASGTQA